MAEEASALCFFFFNCKLNVREAVTFAGVRGSSCSEGEKKKREGRDTFPPSHANYLA